MLMVIVIYIYINLIFFLFLFFVCYIYSASGVEDLSRDFSIQFLHCVERCQYVASRVEPGT